ncbi:prepilin-type N-terminal cleavage/methylation domain-containing protein [Shewanella eurypsychrophilus]|uniref:Prepilin-type N-terminal cleavage/methylation domain-containing protein n=1 Tax=Shewanella eurypsychrophilus TaxID=2593656 RepID=A0ABX6V7S3_9GAMM|nr:MULTISPECIES: prepilin-type N-terminal cleavage/methylation domain-containing protein [Shewanella]QFU23453.1 prepilin-type N-terminal cleavage/methylation domain-containing protein [Shewanella sp. YLB-09]QPG58682.1 prepilin-type N-terminal cleavage/methylation domain-containing protein [Shewanella eurypsychrophilus]
MILDKKLTSGDGFTLIELLVVLTIGMLLISLVGGVGMNMVDKTQTQREVLKFQSLVKESSYKAYLCKCTQTMRLGKTDVTIGEHSDRSSVFYFEKITFSEQLISFHRTGLPSTTRVRYYRNEKWQTLDLIELLNSKF